MKPRTAVRIGATSSLVLGLVLIIVASLNLRIRPLGTDPEDIRPGDVFCITVPETIGHARTRPTTVDALKQEIDTSLRAVALVWTAFIGGIVLSSVSIGVLVYTR